MSDIPFRFCPIPRFFRENGYLKNAKTCSFLLYCFDKCSQNPRDIIIMGLQMRLEPYEFIFGRIACSEETSLTEDEIRTQQKRLIKDGLLVKINSPCEQRFSVYRWVTDRFDHCRVGGTFTELVDGGKKKDPRLDPRPNTRLIPIEKDGSLEYVGDLFDNDKNPNNRLDPRLHTHVYRSTRSSRKSLQSSSVNSDAFFNRDPASLTDDFFYVQKRGKEKPPELIEVSSGVLMSQSDLDACIAVKGSLEAVKNAVDYIQRSKNRKHKIKDWPAAISTWQIKADIKSRAVENEEAAKRLVKKYGSARSWRVEIHTDRKKDQRGILFYNTSSTCTVEPFFISFIDNYFSERVCAFIRDKKMQLSIAD